jgi:hypothetical protein
MRPRGQAVAALVLVVLLAACGETATPTTSAPAATATTTEAPLTSEAVAVAFFEAWQDGDREAMERLSEPDALAQADQLADLAGEPWEQELCEGAAGTVHCIWFTDDDVLAIGVRNIEEPHVVTSFGLVEP